jgi:hypothetical protein
LQEHSDKVASSAAVDFRSVSSVGESNSGKVARAKAHGELLIN